MNCAFVGRLRPDLCTAPAIAWANRRRSAEWSRWMSGRCACELCFCRPTSPGSVHGTGNCVGEQTPVGRMVALDVPEVRL